MASRRDQLQSYQFLMQRVTSALVIHETDPQQSPFRRFAGSAFAGLMIAIIVIGGVAVFGMLRSGGKQSWRDEASIVQEKETGVRYVYRKGTDTLYPVANIASARLLGASIPVSVSRNSLAGVPRGRTIGITGAPDFVPRPQDLLTGAWSLCTVPYTNDAGQTAQRSILLAGRSTTGGQPLGDGAILVKADDANAVTQLVWGNHRFEIREQEVLKALAWDGVQPARVRTAWLNGLDAGQPLTRFAFPPGNSRFQSVPNGRTFVVRNGAGDRQYYVSVPDGLAKITALQAEVIRGDPDLNPGGSEAREIQASQVLASPQQFLAPSQPAVTPKLTTVDADDTVCATYPARAGAEAEVRIGAKLDSGTPANDTGGSTNARNALADRVLIEPGHAVLAVALPSKDAEGGTMVLVTEPGRAFPVTPEVANQMLGLPLESAVRLPAGVVNRIPLGPALDPTKAGLPV